MDDSHDEIRSTLIELLASGDPDDFTFTRTASRDGLLLAREIAACRYGRPSEFGLVDYILGLLRSAQPLKAVPMGEPAGSCGTAYAMTNVDGAGLYIKLKLEDDRVVVVSFHRTKHS